MAGSLIGGGSSNFLSERLLRQNAELTGFVSRLTEEKSDLRNQTLRLEEELRRHRRAGLLPQDTVSTTASLWTIRRKVLQYSGLYAAKYCSTLANTPQNTAVL